MRILVESIKRLYSSGSISAEKLSEMAVQHKITEEEKRYILSENLIDETSNS